MNGCSSIHTRSLALCLLVLLSIGYEANAGDLLRETQQLPDVAPGVPMTIKSFAASTNAEEILYHYERQLRMGPDLKTKRSHEDGWRVLAVLAPRYYITIRARDTAHGTEGTIAVSPALATVSASRVMSMGKRTSFPHPESTHVVNLQQYDDDGIEAEHISLVSARSVTIEAREFSSLLARQGWQLLRSEATAQRRGGHVIEAQKAAALALINLQRGDHGGETSILIVWRKA
jgi:hypothetical protein